MGKPASVDLNLDCLSASPGEIFKNTDDPRDSDLTGLVQDSDIGIFVQLFSKSSQVVGK